MVGTAEGDLLLVNGSGVTALDATLANKNSVNALWSTPSGGFVLAGLKDGSVVVNTYDNHCWCCCVRNYVYYVLGAWCGGFYRNSFL